MKTIDFAGTLSKIEAKVERYRRKLMRKISKPLSQRRKQLEAELRHLACFIPGVNLEKLAKGPRKASKGKRKRRDAKALEKVAHQIAEFVKSKKAEGASGRDIRKAIPDAAKIQNLKAWIKKYGGITLATKGKKAGMIYFNVQG